MSREIKFRAYSNESGMIEISDNSKIVLEFNKISGWNIVPNLPNYKGEYLAGESQSKTPDFKLMQYTGLKDKNGKEIYEGDLVINGKDERCYEVKYSDQYGSFVLFYNESIVVYNINASVLEFCGNIHENPELLK